MATAEASMSTGDQRRQQEEQPGFSGRRDSPPRAVSDDLARALQRIQSGAVRGALIGLTLRGGLHLAGYALGALGSGGGGARARQKRAVTGGAAVRESLRYAAFLGSLAATYIGVEEGIARVFGKERSSRWRALVAGACAGPTLLLTGPKERHYSLAVYVLLRGITLLIRTGNRPSAPPLLRALLAPTRLEHGDAMLMCACCGQIIYAFIMHPETLPPSYVRFIRKQGAKELFVYQGIQELARRSARRLPLHPLSSLAGTPHAAAAAPIPCGFFHPGQSCAGHAVSILPRNYERALRVYVPVYLLPMLLVHRQRLLKEPLPILNKAAFGVARSSLFLSLCISVAFGGACAGHNMLGRTGPSILALSTWVGGLALLVEKKSRRMELALYVLSRSLESFSRCLVEWGWLRPRAFPARMDVALFAAGCGAIMHCYSDGNGRYRGCFHSKYRNLLDFVFGGDGITEGAITHIPSNEQLLHAVSLRVSRSFRSLSSANLVGLGGSSGNLAARAAREEARAARIGGGGGGGGGGGARRPGRASEGEERAPPLQRGSSDAGGRGVALAAAAAAAAAQQAPGCSGSGGGGAPAAQQHCPAQAGEQQPLQQQQQQQQQQQMPPHGAARPASGLPPVPPPAAPGSKGPRRRSMSLDDSSAILAP
ncbi:MAG: hypothetical protein J3K34DRAFT_524830 [Monoraphidium minutum]|nr:MAG: hypothetical protein J3K34DRAFT_524830 [Monoraphidium minutum]